MGPPISSEFRSMIKAYKEEGKSYTQAFELLQENHPDDYPSLKTVYNIYKLIDEQGDTNHHLVGNVGRKSKLSPQEEQEVVVQFEQNPQLSLRKASNTRTEDQTPVCFKTISNILTKNNFSAYKKPSRIMINEDQQNERLRFAQSVKSWRSEWKDVLFSDECIIKQSKIGNKYVWVRDKEDITDDLCYEKIKYPIKLHVFGVISYEGPHFLIQIKGKLDSKAYQDLLLEGFDEMGYEFVTSKVFQQDRASCHFSTSTKEHFQDRYHQTNSTSQYFNYIYMLNFCINPVLALQGNYVGGQAIEDNMYELKLTLPSAQTSIAVNVYIFNYQMSHIANKQVVFLEQ